MSEKAKEFRRLHLTKGLIEEMENDKSGRVTELVNAFCEMVTKEE